MVTLPPAARQAELEAAQQALLQRYHRDIDFIRMQGEEQFLANSFALANNRQEAVPVFLEMRAKQAERDYEVYDNYIREAALHNRNVRRFQMQMTSAFASLPVILRRFQLLELLGASDCGIELWKARDSTTNEIIVLNISSDKLMLAYDHKALSRLDVNQNLIRVSSEGILDFNYNATPYSLYAREFIEDDLLSILHRRPNGRLIHIQADVIALRIAQAIQHLDIDCRVAHCDIRPSNILVANNFAEVKLINFKSSRSRRELLPTIPHHKVKEMNSEQLLFCSPEYFSCHECTGNFVVCGVADVWALGVLFFMMLYGHHPLARGLVVLDDAMKLKFVEELRQFECVQFPPTPEVKEGVKRTIAACLMRDPRRRLKSSELVSMSFFH